MKYKPMNEVSKEELDEFVMDALYPVKYQITESDEDKIVISMWSKWADDSDELFEDIVKLHNNGQVYSEFTQPGLETQWMMFIFAKGLSLWFKNNKYLEVKE